MVVYFNVNLSNGFVFSAMREAKDEKEKTALIHNLKKNSNQINKGEMDYTCSTHVEIRKAYEILVRKIVGRSLRGLQDI